MTDPLELHPAAEAALVALVDDCLPPCRRAELESRVAADPALAAALAAQRRALSLLAHAAPCPSAALAERIAACAARGRMAALIAATRRAGAAAARRPAAP